MLEDDDKKKPAPDAEEDPIDATEVPEDIGEKIGETHKHQDATPL